MNNVRNNPRHFDQDTCDTISAKINAIGSLVTGKGEDLGDWDDGKLAGYLSKEGMKKYFSTQGVSCIPFLRYYFTGDLDPIKSVKELLIATIGLLPNPNDHSKSLFEKEDVNATATTDLPDVRLTEGNNVINWEVTMEQISSHSLYNKLEGTSTELADWSI